MAGQTFAIEVGAESSAPATANSAVVTDATGWSDWAGPLIGTSYWGEEGDPVPAGVGAVRVLGRKPLLLREETVEFERDRRHVYALRTPAPLADYRGEVRLIPRDGGGTDVVWRVTFRELIPFTGPLLRVLITALVKDLTARAIRAAER